MYLYLIQIQNIFNWSKYGGPYYRLLTMFLTFFNSVDIPPNHLQVVPGHYHGDGSKLLFLCAMLRVVKSSIAQKA